MFFTRYKRVAGKIVHARGALHDVRLDIDIAGRRIKGIFKGDVELERLRGSNVLVYIPRIENVKKEHKAEIKEHREHKK